MLIAGGCAYEGEDGLPVGALAKVGNTVIDEAALVGLRSELGAYARLRFRGHEGMISLLGVGIDLELMHQQAEAAGLHTDPRVTWRQVEELARREVDAELERRVPRAAVVADRPALSTWLDTHRQQLTPPEKRSVWFASFANWALADAALSGLRSGTLEPSAMRTVGETQLLARDDHEFPLFHRILFDPQLHEGDWLPLPVYAEQVVLAARVHKIVPGTAPSLDDPAIFAKVVDGVLAERRKQAEIAFRHEVLRRTYPSE